MAPQFVGCLVKLLACFHDAAEGGDFRLPELRNVFTGRPVVRQPSDQAVMAGDEAEVKALVAGLSDILFPLAHEREIEPIEDAGPLDPGRGPFDTLPFLFKAIEMLAPGLVFVEQLTGGRKRVFRLATPWTMPPGQGAERFGWTLVPVLVLEIFEKPVSLPEAGFDPVETRPGFVAVPCERLMVFQDTGEIG